MQQPPVTPLPAPAREPVAVADAVLDRLARLSSGSITTQLFKKGLRQCVLVGLRPLQGARAPRFAGRAFTLRMIPAREDIDTYATLTTTPNADNLQWVGVERTLPGDVMVIDSRNDTTAASMGNMLVTRMMKRGARGVVTDGAFTIQKATTLFQTPYGPPVNAVSQTGAGSYYDAMPDGQKFLLVTDADHTSEFQHRRRELAVVAEVKAAPLGPASLPPKNACNHHLIRADDDVASSA